MLKWGLVGFSDFCWTPIDDVVSYVWLSCHLFWWDGSLGPFGIDHWGLLLVLLVFALFYGWYDPGPTISDVEFNRMSGSNPLTALLAYKLNWGGFWISGLKFGLYYGPGVILYFFSPTGNYINSFLLSINLQIECFHLKSFESCRPHSYQTTINQEFTSMSCL